MEIGRNNFGPILPGPHFAARVGMSPVSSGTVSNATPVPTLQALLEAIEKANSMPRPEWVLIDPAGNVYTSEDPVALAIRCKAHTYGLGHPTPMAE